MDTVFLSNEDVKQTSLKLEVNQLETSLHQKCIAETVRETKGHGRSCSQSDDPRYLT